MRTQPRGRWWQLSVAVVILVVSCPPVRLAAPIRGIVIDEETRTPIAGASVAFTASTHCTAFVDTVTRTLQVDSVRSNPGGRFTVGGGADMLFPLCIGWESNIAAVAPGYYASSTNWVTDSIFFGTPWPLHLVVPVAVPLRRLRYLLPSFRHGHMAPSSYRPIGPKGVFVSQPDGKLDRLATDGRKPVLYAASSAAGTAYGWDDEGRAVGVRNDRVSSRLLASSHKTHEITRLRGWLYQSSWRLPAEREVLENLLEDEPAIECVASTGDSQPLFVVVANDHEDHAVFIVTPFPYGGQRVFRTRFPPPDSRRGSAPFVVHAAPYPSGEMPEAVAVVGISSSVTACALLDMSLYVAFAGGGIRRYDLGARHDPLTELRFWDASRPVTLDAEGGPKTFTDIEVGWVMTDTELDRVPAVYAVTGGPDVFRFGDEGRPDQRFEFR